MKTDTIQDYQTANNEAKALFESLGITTQITAPIGSVKDNWPCILYGVHFTLGSKSLITEYRLGIGHVNWKIKTPSSFMHHLSGDQESMVYAVQNNPSATFKNKELQASTAAQLARSQKVAPKPYEVLACVCSDGLSAHNESFEGYADNFGMDKDSIKAKALYGYCGELYHRVVALIGSENVQKFAELQSQF